MELDRIREEPGSDKAMYYFDKTVADVIRETAKELKVAELDEKEEAIHTQAVEKVKEVEHGGILQEKDDVVEIDPEIIRIEHMRKPKEVEIVPEMKAYIVEKSGRYQRTLTEGLHLCDPWEDEIIAYEYCLKDHSIPTLHGNVITGENNYTSYMSLDGVIRVKVVDPN
ncbi:OLC1v1028420C1 [Oldenlandia corymbosa var. corymbosa]|uniref:OLC1v1028420C1 n=1 Tax=Oldenlandia corymbosa var. corymbosa TaxID=529605 RepID=A0AAV1CDH2_OLDCO|nr:OLC1v1028420C1 [Oldenlandia corymbosa var. corymbosa]